MRREIKDDFRKQYDLYVNNLVGYVKANPRNFCWYIGGQKKDNQRRGGTGITTSEIEQAEEFNGQFTDVFNKSDNSEVPFLSRSTPLIDDIVVSNEAVTKLLKGLNTSKAFFQQSLDMGEIPKEFANICPLYKKGDRALACT